MLEGTTREQIRTCNYPPQARKKQGAVFHPSDSRPCASTDLSKPALFLSEICFCDLLSVIFFFILVRSRELTKQRRFCDGSFCLSSFHGRLLRF